MRIPIPLTIVLAAGVVLASCFGDRGVLFVDPSVDDGGVKPTGGTSGSNGGASGNSGVAGAPGCDVAPIMLKSGCTIDGVCHGTMPAAGLDLRTSGWQMRLLGTGPTRGAGLLAKTMCADQGRIYLVPGSNPAVGLLMDKLRPNPPCGAQMPFGLPALQPQDLECFQAWATALTTNAR
ncbi:MAG: hypothetical protein JWM82_3015 [Myxococcales bacterium]|nr:hypothetical protein [Myxococcales bacterium]